MFNRDNVPENYDSSVQLNNINNNTIPTKFFASVLNAYLKERHTDSHNMLKLQ